MAGLRDVWTAIPPILTAQLAITNPTTALATARLAGSTDATIGTVGWLPPTDNSPFAVLTAEGSSEKTPEPNRVWATHDVRVFIGVAHVDTTSSSEDYNDVAVAWADAMRQVVAANRRIEPASLSGYPTSGDVRWDMVGWKLVPHRLILGVPYYGIDVLTHLLMVISVDYQG